MACKLRISGIERESIVDGPGIRYVVFTQGCPHACPGCHNPQTHSFDGGTDVDIENLFDEIKQNPLLSGVTFSGGEPFCQPGPLYELGKKVKGIGKTIVAYSGYTIEQLIKMAEKDPMIMKLLDICDVLVDGPYIESLRDISLKYRGSSNQRYIDLKEYFKR